MIFYSKLILFKWKFSIVFLSRQDFFRFLSLTDSNEFLAEMKSACVEEYHCSAWKIPPKVYVGFIHLKLTHAACWNRNLISINNSINSQFLHPEWNSDVKESLFLGFFVNQSLLSSPRSRIVDSWRRFCYFLSQLIFNRFIEFSHLGVNNSWLI